MQFPLVQRKNLVFSLLASIVFGSPSGQPPPHLMFVHLFHDGDILFGWKHLGGHEWAVVLKTGFANLNKIWVNLHWSGSIGLENP